MRDCINDATCPFTRLEFVKAQINGQTGDVLLLSILRIAHFFILEGSLRKT